MQLVPIEIGRDYGPSVEVLSGLQEGDLVVSTVTDAVQPGVKVRTQENPQVAQTAGRVPVGTVAEYRARINMAISPS